MPKKQEKWWAKERKKLGVSHSTYNEYCKEKLEGIFKQPVRWSCESCLQLAFEALRDGKNGYVTDEELIESSGGRLRHK